MRYLSVCSGIEAATVAWLDGGVHGRHGSPNGGEVGAADLSDVGEAVAIRAKNYAVFQGVLPALRAGNDVVRVARAFRPAAPHTGIGEQAAHGLHPRSPVCVSGAAGKNVGLALVPRRHAAAVASVRPKGIDRAGLSGVVPLNKPARPPFVVELREHSSAPAFAGLHAGDALPPLVLVSLEEPARPPIRRSGWNLRTAPAFAKIHRPDSISSDEGLYFGGSK